MLFIGYVTDNTTLTQEHSKLYHYLAGFEEDSKRKLAMETRRVELLLPLVKALNVISYEVLHKQVCCYVSIGVSIVHHFHRWRMNWVRLLLPS